MLPFVAKAQGDVTAVWDFKNHLPAGINEATAIEGTTGEITSTVEGITMLHHQRKEKN